MRGRHAARRLHPRAGRIGATGRRHAPRAEKRIPHPAGAPPGQDSRAGRSVLPPGGAALRRQSGRRQCPLPVARIALCPGRRQSAGWSRDLSAAVPGSEDKGRPNRSARVTTRRIRRPSPKPRQDRFRRSIRCRSLLRPIATHSPSSTGGADFPRPALLKALSLRHAQFVDLFFLVQPAGWLPWTPSWATMQQLPLQLSNTPPAPRRCRADIML